MSAIYRVQYSVNGSQHNVKYNCHKPMPEAELADMLRQQFAKAHRVDPGKILLTVDGPGTILLPVDHPAPTAPGPAVAEQSPQRTTSKRSKRGQKNVGAKPAETTVTDPVDDSQGSPADSAD